MELLANDLSLDVVTLTEWQEVEFSCAPPPNATLALLIEPQPTPLSPFLRPGDATWRWRWNPQNAVGRFICTLQATFAAGQIETQRFSFHVAPRKIDQEHYLLLLDEVQQSAQSILYALAGGATGAAFQAVEPHGRTLLEEYFSLFDERFEALERAIERIARHPHTALRAANERVPTGQAQDVTQLQAELARGGAARSVGDTGQMQDPSSGLDPALAQVLPPEVVQARSRSTTDTYENRLLKRLLAELYQRARYVAAAASQRSAARRTAAEPFQRMAERCQAVQRRLRELQTLPFLADVGPLRSFHGPSQVLQRDPNYRQIYRLWQAIRRSVMLAIDSPLFHIPLADLPRLYECWCTLHVVQTLIALPDAIVKTQRLLVVQGEVGTANGDLRAYTFALVEHEPLLVLTWRDTTLRLRYQPRYRPQAGKSSPASPQTPLVSLDRHTRVPDLALEIERPDQSCDVLVFDAKYRLDARGSVPEDALADAYTYLGSIGRLDGERVVRAALLLYPGVGEAEYYASGVGALPLLPGTTTLGPWLEMLLGQRT